MKPINAIEGGAQGHLTGLGSKAYRNYVLFARTFTDLRDVAGRALPPVVGSELVPALVITATAFGLLTRFGCALLYTAVGIPLARFAEVANRVWIMTVCVALWSV